MCISKRNLLLAGSVLAAITMVVGCGNGDNQHKAPIRKSIPTKVTTPDANKKATTPGGTPGTVAGDARNQGGNSSGGDQTKGGTPDATKKSAVSDPNEPKVQQQEAALIPTDAKAVIGADQLQPGVYKLDNSDPVVSAIFMNTGANQARAIQHYSMQTNGSTQYQVVTSDNKLSGGTVTFLPSFDRSIDLPLQFEVRLDNNKKWNINPDDSSVVTVALKTDTKLDNNNKLMLKDSLATASGSRASILKILAGTTPDSTGAYKAQDETSKPMQLSIYKIDNQTFRIYLSIQESNAANTNAANDPAKNVSFERHLFLNYKFTPAAPAANPQSKPAADAEPAINFQSAPANT